MIHRIFYAQSGGVTSVINATLVGLVRQAHKHSIEVLIGLNGIHGLIEGNYVSSLSLLEEDLKKIENTPGGSFGSCRYKPDPRDFDVIYEQILADRIDAIVYQGGNDSQLTLHMLCKFLKEKSSLCHILGIPKTIDNDLRETDVCPGFGSAAFFLALSMRQLCLDLRSMCLDSTKIYIVETMGRHAGWLTASAGLSHCRHFPGPQILLLPERPVKTEDLLKKIQQCVEIDGYCAIALSEGYSPDPLSSIAQPVDPFGNKVLSGSALALQKILAQHLPLKSRICLPDYLQRSCALLRSHRDFEQSQALGRYAIDTLISGESCHGKMLTLCSNPDTPGQWSIGMAPLKRVAGVEKAFPLHYLTAEGWELSDEGRAYMEWAIGPEGLITLASFWPHYLSRG